ncbi:MAG: hypothetical protein ACPGID_10210 [Rubricella sp.]
MTETALWASAIFGMVCIGTIARVGVAWVSGGRMLRPLLWALFTLGFALALEIRAPLGASFEGVMRGFIFLAAKVI